MKSNPLGVTCHVDVPALEGDWDLDALERECAEVAADEMRSDGRLAFWSVSPGKRALRVHVRIVHDAKTRNIQASFDVYGCTRPRARCHKGEQKFNPVTLYSQAVLDSKGLPDAEKGPPQVLRKIRDDLFDKANRTALWEVLRKEAPFGYNAQWLNDPPPERRDLILPFDWPDASRNYLSVLQTTTRVRIDDYVHPAKIYSLSTLTQNKAAFRDLAKAVRTGVIARARCVAVNGGWKRPEKLADLRSTNLTEVYVHSVSFGALPPVSAECAVIEKETAGAK